MKEYGKLPSSTIEQQHQIVNAIENLQDVFLLLNPEGVITYVNGAAATFFGMQPEDMIGDLIDYYIPNAAVFVDHERKVIKEISLESYFYKDQNKWVELRISPSYSGYSCLIKDISFNKKIENDFYKRNKEMSIINKTTEQLIIHNEPKGLLDHLFVSFSELFGIDVFISFIFDEKLNKLKLYHYKGISENEGERFSVLSMGEAICGTVAETKKSITIDLVQSSDNPKVALIKDLGIKAYVSLPLISYGVFLGTLSFGSKSKDHFSFKEIEIMQKFCYYVAISLDRMLLISELKENENKLQKSLQAIQHSEEFLHKLIKLCPIPMGYFDISRKIIGVTDAFLKIFEYEMDEVINHKVGDLALWNTDKGGRSEFLAELFRKGYVYNKEVELQTKSGILKKGYLSATKARLDKKEYVICIFNDVTDLKKLEKEMLRLDQLNIVGEMAAGIAHEVRNPMTTIKGFLQLQSHKEDDPESKTYTKLMLDELDRANSIISEFLSLAKDYRYRKETCNLNDIIYELLPLINADGMVSGHSIFTKLGDLPNIKLDKKQIKQVLLNLFRNGLEAMPDGGALTIETLSCGKEVVLYVKDEGTGIDPEIVDEIWKPFFTSKQNGTGLGLAICYRIINDHGGAISVDSCKTGTIFTINLKTV